MIELQNLSKTFQSNGKTVTAVNDVSLTVNEGEICVFLGPSGCGKSTTLKMINRLIKPTSGKILINGEDTTGLDAVTLRRSIGYVIQQIGLFPNMTIAATIGAGGLGVLILASISRSDMSMLIVGAVLVSLLAIFADLLLQWLQRSLTPKGLLK